MVALGSSVELTTLPGGWRIEIGLARRPTAAPYRTAASRLSCLQGPTLEMRYFQSGQARENIAITYRS